LFPTLNAYSASALLSTASLKHLIISPYEELAPSVLGSTREGREAGGAISHAGEAGIRPTATAGAGCGGVDALCLRDFCEAVRFEG
ncbi:unnamed protein product, partial [Sphacelaria rigidula]